MISNNRLDKRDIKRLEIFCEIVEQGGINQAVASTGMSQPVLSNQLIALEKSLELTLCQRGRKGFKLTHEGEKVYNYANQLKSTLTDFAYKLRGVQTELSGHVRIGCLDNTVSLPNNPLPKTIEAFYQLSNSVEVSVEVGDFTQLNEKLAKNQIDMMIVVLGSHQKSAFQYKFPLFDEHSYLYARRDLAEKIMDNHFSLDGCRINMGGYARDEMFTLLDIEQYDAVKPFDGWHVESGVILTLAGTHLSFLPSHLIDRGHYDQALIALQPDKWSLTSQFYLVLKQPIDSLPPAARAFFDLLECVDG
ncbi:LysR family transcriptional regulator [Vibrio sp. 10N.286.49.B3]|uniref:LysR family transcriptional regulator n=1 Tax=Vibrio sp. 10N.286.49.B3 TaxID=1880855 RepID=UPI000C842F8C|nr:LysR family transcriptional regulator [Vibrio sp. 10N.286.49.B3]PMH46173.1 LysR family transcriptional regulator [Vibrio sp. 10N.286.49.B3]